MIQYKGLSPRFRAEDINFVNYIINLTPTKALKYIRLEEAWGKIKFDVNYSCVFGSEAWVHFLDEKRK